MSDTPKHVHDGQAVINRLEQLIKRKGKLSVLHNHGGGGMGFYWEATINSGWPTCVGSTLNEALLNLVNKHEELERAELLNRLNEIDASAGL